MQVKVYQELYSIYNSSFDEVDKLALMVCCYYNLTPDEVDKIKPAIFLKKVDNVVKDFQRIRKP